MRDLEHNREPYYLNSDSAKTELDSLYDTLNNYYGSLRSKSAYKDKLKEMLNDLEDEH